MQKRWRVLESVSAMSPEAFPQLHPIAVRLFANRGITDPLEAEAFLHPDWETGTHDPFLFSRMREAVGRVLEAIAIGERIAVHGDYDADGVTGTAVVLSALREVAMRSGKDPDLVEWYIPHRNDEGYGLHHENVHQLKGHGVMLLLTVDCGIASVDEIAAARAHGIDVVVLDHHAFGDILPDAILVHPRLPGETYPFGDLAAVGVAWKFAAALVVAAREQGIAVPDGWEKWMLDLVSIATVTDMVPVLGENRVLLKYGLLVLNKTRREGLKRLVLAAGRSFGSLDAETVGFVLGPRINAAGRMDHASLALRLMLAEGEEEAAGLAGELEALNRARQQATDRMMREAEGLLVDIEKHRAVAVWHPEWPPSLVGLVAGKIMDRTGKPCIAIGRNAGMWIGSGRSPGTFDITSCVRKVGEGILSRFGGHTQACGFSLEKDEDVPTFADRFRAEADATLTDEDVIPVLDTEALLTLEDIDWKLVETLQAFEPFGIGNLKPHFATHDVLVEESALVGQAGNHLRCVLRSPGGAVQKFIGFKMGSRLPDLAVGKRVDVVYDVGVNVWNGRTEIQCSLVDCRSSEEGRMSS
ncbi:MAG: single-stranded-DNA-specific exonuclease RecJ [Patescibacteria group bacterium]